MSEVDSKFRSIVTAESVDVDCQVPNYSSTAKHWCVKVGHWLVRPACQASAGDHTAEHPWWVCCDGCREVFEALTTHCPKCGQDCHLEVEVV